MAFFFSPPLPPPFPAPSLVVFFFFVFQDGGHDQCTCEFPLRNASHRKSRLRSFSAFVSPADSGKKQSALAG